MVFGDILRRIADPSADFTQDEFEAVTTDLIEGRFTLAQVGALLGALRIRGASVNVLTAAARVLLRRSRHLNPPRRPVVDIFSVGPGGAGTDYVVSAAALTAAAAGAPVARAAGSSTDNTGGVDIIRALGLPLQVPRSLIEKGIDRFKFGFMYEPDMHPLLHQFAPVRRDLGVRTVFDEIVPLANPANPEGRIAGVEDEHDLKPYAAVLRNLGVQLGYVICGADGINKATVHGPSKVILFETGGEQEFTFDPKVYGFKPRTLNDIRRPGTADQIADLLIAVIEGREGGPCEDMVVVNAGFALHVAGARGTLEECFDLARETVRAGKPLTLLRAVSNLYKSTESSPAISSYAG